VLKVTPDGKVLLKLGMPGKPAHFMSGEPSQRCICTVLSPEGEIYFCDGYGQARAQIFA
jgi:hypothetical protein